MIRDAVAVVSVAVFVFLLGYGVIQWNVTKAKADKCDEKVAALNVQLREKQIAIDDLAARHKKLIEDGKAALALSEEAIKLAKERSKVTVIRAQQHREIAMQPHEGRTCEKALQEVFR